MYSLLPDVADAGYVFMYSMYDVTYVYDDVTYVYDDVTYVLAAT